MAGGGGEPPPPPVNGGEFILKLLQNPPHHPPPPPPAQILTHDPAVAAIGPSLSVPFPPLFQANCLPPPWPHHHSPPPPFAPHNFFLQNPNPNANPNFNSVSQPGGCNQGPIQQQNVQFSYDSPGDDIRNLGFLGTNSKVSSAHQRVQKDLIFGSLSGNEGVAGGNFGENRFVSQEGKAKMGFGNNARRLNGVEVESQLNSIDFDRDHTGNLSTLRGHGQGRSGSNSSGARNWVRQGHNLRAAVPPPGFVVKQNREVRDGSSFEQNGEKGRNNYGESRYQVDKGKRERRFLSKNGKDNGGRLVDRRVSDQLESPGPPPGSKLHLVSASDIEKSMIEMHGGDDETREEFGIEMRMDDNKGQSDLDGLEEQLVDSLGLEDELDEKSYKKKHHGPRDKDYRSDKRGQSILGQRMRYLKRQLICPGDIDRLNAPFLAIYESLIPAKEEKVKQKQLLTLLEKIVSHEWPEARLFTYGSCANSFGFPKSDIDVCLSIEDYDGDKSEVLLKLADMLQSDNLQNVQALTRARVPVVKLMDPTTGISCDICVNNILAVVNTKLLQDYADIDVRLLQLAFIVKHWAKSRGVNETYQGTLSSYAYVLMCIHFLQQRRPAILPCLQGMEATYSVTVDNVECAYFDQVKKLIGFGSHNGESISQLVWAFFNYWAYYHDYANDVISVRTGGILSKRSKDWTRRIGNDRHLICIEDPFEVSHDLGRVVDKFSIRVLREEFERAAEIMQYDPKPCVTLFEPYMPT